MVMQWRTQFRKDMNRSEAQANNRAIDSLINYETVKYCGNEEHEVQRYDECMHKYQVRPTEGFKVDRTPSHVLAATRT